MILLIATNIVSFIGGGVFSVLFYIHNQKKVAAAIALGNKVVTTAQDIANSAKSGK